MGIPTIEEVLDYYPGNKAVYARLQDLLSRRLAVGFVGAGASFPLYPLWGQLIERFANEPVRQGLATEDDKNYWIRRASTKPLQMASQIRQKLGDANYFALLFETFKLKIGANNLPYTSTHAALTKINPKALVTTNYDPGLIEAQRDSFPRNSLTGFSVWNQAFQVSRWASGDIYRDRDIAPIMFAHGHYEDPLNIILDHESYNTAYNNTSYRRFFENLWLQEYLFFVGFGFNDVVLTQIADDILGKTIRQGGGPPRHIALLAWPVDTRPTAECRREYLYDYNAEIILYPLRKLPDGTLDHSAVNVILDSFVPNEISLTSRLAAEPRYSADENTPIPTWFAHESTEDELFIDREILSKRMDTWASDGNVRIIAVSAIGGQGKTSFVTHWVRYGMGSASRRVEGIFFWSFYRDSEISNFFRSLLDFGDKQLNYKSTNTRKSVIERCLELLSGHRLIAVMDGLEVVQEAAGTIAYGKVLDYNLADFLHRHCNSRTDSLILLTSRFPFPDLTPYLGGALRTLPLPELSKEEGAKLLGRLGINGTEADREIISGQLSGHPLALRLFARSMPQGLQGDPTRLWEKIFSPSSLAEDDSLTAKMNRLLAFYEAHLPASHRRALGLIALFRTPVSENTLSLLWKNLPPGTQDENSLFCALDNLRQDHLLNIDPAANGAPSYSCHPILRDHFRTSILEQGMVAKQVVNLLSGRPSSTEVITLAAAQAIATSIELLISAGEFRPADDLYISRFRNGQVFHELTNPLLGMVVANEFVRDANRRMVLRKQIGELRLSYYLNEVGLFADLAGEAATALTYYKDAEILDRKRPTRGARVLSVTLQNVGSVETQLGLLSNAASHYSESIKILKKIDADELRRDAFAYSAYVASLRGSIIDAEKKFSKACEFENSISNEDLYGMLGIFRAEHLLRLGKFQTSCDITTQNLEICRRNSWAEDEIQGIWMLGWLAIYQQKMDFARECLDEAKSRFNSGHMMYFLARVLLTEVEMQAKLKNWEVALSLCERAIHLAAPRSYRLIHADALNLRASIWLHHTYSSPHRSRDDAESALQLAEHCRYAWAERDSHNILAMVFEQIGQYVDSKRHQEEAALWNNRLIPK